MTSVIHSIGPGMAPTVFLVRMSGADGVVNGRKGRATGGQLAAGGTMGSICGTKKGVDTFTKNKGKVRLFGPNTLL